MADELGRPRCQRLIAMALLSGDYAEKYYTNHAEIHPMVCLGHILRHESLPDGKYNLILRGVARVKIVEEDRLGDYRLAKLEPVPTVVSADSDKVQHELWCQLRDLLCSRRFACLAEAIRYEDWFESGFKLGHLTDLLSYYILHDHVEIKQEFLQELDDTRRAQMLLRFLEGLTPPVVSSPPIQTAWPPSQGDN